MHREFESPPLRHRPPCALRHPLSAFRCLPSQTRAHPAQRRRRAGAVTTPRRHAAAAAPFLKWAGGKAQLAPRVLANIPPGFHGYHEPFVGGGAVFFAVRGAFPDRPACLGDANPDLIDCYRVVRDEPGRLIEVLERHAAAYDAEGEEGRAAYYYRQRDLDPVDPVERAARLVFLNKTAFNGLYRVNAAGRFNVPHGRYRHPRIADPGRIEAASAALRGTDLRCEDFEAACARAATGDFVYLDPPYQPLSTTSSFTSYTRADFGPREQARLAAVFADLAGRGVAALLSNSDHPAIRALYEGCGYRVEVVPMARAINSRGDRRTPVPELLIANFG